MREYIQDFAMDKNMSKNQLKANMNHSPQLKEEFLNYVEQRRKEKTMAKSATIKKRENAPDFVFGSFGYKLEDLKPFVNDKGYINFDILAGKEGGYYVKVNDYGIKPSVTKSDTVLNFDDEEIPF